MPRKSMQTLSEPMYYVLLALTKELYGTEIMKEVRLLSKERIKIGPGTLYTMLDKFLSAGLITRTNKSLSTKSYIITPEGKRALKAEYDRLSALIRDGEKIMGVFL
ncbi:MAG: PadR family transcriptional regulator [Clostridia bacterium]|nr:PadR family transcriptional regulator [Clostridia bacterium]MBR2892629.1 PadR family transcriptional regulator [Clostridia bacterium]